MSSASTNGGRITHSDFDFDFVFGSERVRTLTWTCCYLPWLGCEHYFRVNWSISQPRNCLNVGTAHECLLAA